MTCGYWEVIFGQTMNNKFKFSEIENICLGKMRKNQNSDKYTSDLKSDNWEMTRRVFLKSSLLFTALPLFSSIRAVAGVNGRETDSQRSLVKFGLVTDSHYADIDAAGTRYYRESDNKMKECIGLMNQKKVDFIAHLGDFKNGAPDRNLENLKRIESLYAGFNGPRYHVLGNHDTDSISKEDFLSVVNNTGIDPERTFYSFDRGGMHFVVLDANFTNNGEAYNQGNFHWTDANVPEYQLSWLDKDLADTDKPVIIFNHQLLDGDEGNHYIKNAATVRRILERNGNVLIAFQGHQHAGQYSEINNIHYYTLKAMVEGSGEENNAYAIVEVFDNLTVSISGYRKASDKKLYGFLR